MDDVAGGGDEVWQRAVAQLRERFKFSVWKKGTGRFCGRNVEQYKDGSIRVGQHHYAKAIDYVVIDVQGLEDKNEKVQEKLMGVPLSKDPIKTCRRSLIRLFAFMVIAFLGGICAHVLMVSLGMDEKLRDKDLDEIELRDKIPT